MTVQAADALMSIFGFGRVTLHADDESGKTADQELLEVVMSDKMREEFQEWHASRMIARGHDQSDVDSEFDRDETGEYVYWEAADSWLIWQASRAALVVELPTPCSTQFETVFEMSAACDFVEECREAIRAAGVKTK